MSRISSVSIMRSEGSQRVLFPGVDPHWIGLLIHCLKPKFVETRTHLFRQRMRLLPGLGRGELRYQSLEWVQQPYSSATLVKSSLLAILLVFDVFEALGVRGSNAGRSNEVLRVETLVEQPAVVPDLKLEVVVILFHVMPCPEDKEWDGLHGRRAARMMSCPTSARLEVLRSPLVAPPTVRVVIRATRLDQDGRRRKVS